MPSKRKSEKPRVAHPFYLAPSTIEALRDIRQRTGRPTADFGRRLIEWAVEQPAIVENLDRALDIASAALTRADKERQRQRDKKGKD